MPSALVITDSSVRREHAIGSLRAGRELDPTFTPAGRSDATTERFDPITCLDDRIRHRGTSDEPGEPGRYIQIQGLDRTLLIALGAEVTHIGRGLAADLHLDDISVSRRHAVLVPRSSGHRILDDRSFNGTFVNGRRVQQFDLRNGDVIVLGRVVLRYLDCRPRRVPASPERAQDGPSPCLAA